MAAPWVERPWAAAKRRNGETRLTAIPRTEALAVPVPGLSSSSLRSQIHSDLRRRLQRAEFGAGHRFVDTEVATEYGTSRMPAREALMALASQGFLRQTSRGFVVPQLSPQDIRDIFAVRKLLEPEAAASAAQSLDEAGIADLQAACDMARAACARDDAVGLMEANIAFRAVWLAAVSNRRLVEAIEGFRSHIQTVRIATLRRPATRVVVLDGIEGLSAAFAARDPDAVRARMLAFMNAAEEEFFLAVRAEELEADNAAG
jgi:DNA-binding GntR family transcriptional regulator